ncbi:protein phosphatase 2C-related protein [Tieghemostelium lacteum]|uniref:Protein phosphatase 2C-related protein n=1 Tax=Tieghemostelium lacteum TaxID=361077 RepID=A0A151ZIW6_TIELA|nr:protein phosphatase 2C-related protein [Tieghemostelium lacteum]|eukprot:KYQ93896.1 protein phosphatase 2C-related protein [Tieghemostelium lacteum]
MVNCNEEKDLSKILLGEIQHLERLLQDLIIQRNTNTRRQIVANEDREFLLREGENADLETEWKREEELLKSIIESKKKEFRSHIAETDKNQKIKKQSAFLKSGSALLNIFQSVDEEKFCAALPLINIVYDNQPILVNNNNIIHDNNNNHENNNVNSEQQDSNISNNNNKEKEKEINGNYSSKENGNNENGNINVHKMDDKIITIEGPNRELAEDQQSYKDSVYCKSGSSYPKHKVSGKRQGDPICDRFKVSIYRDRVLVVLADGCNWGRLPFEAANKATDAFLQFLEDNHHEINTIRKAGSYLLSAMTSAHKGIIAGKQEVWEAGTTTLIGGMLVRIDNTKRVSTIVHMDVQYTHCFVGVTLGDCKSFHYSKKNNLFTDITKGNRSNVTDARDPGGRLGPYIGHGEADLRNLSVFYKLCDEDDLILLLSDGVHDNLDPQQLGISPRDLGLQVDTWDEAGSQFPIETDNTKNDFRRKWLSDHFETSDKLEPSYITNHLLKHCMDTTQSSRDFMETNTSKLPSDYKLYPGKMDHNTCVCLKVGSYQP